MAVIFPIISTFDPKGVNAAEKSFKGVGQQANLLKTAFAGIGIVAIAKGLQSTVMAASNLSESIAKSNTVFGKNAKTIEDWSKTTAKSLGVSQQAALEAAGTYGNLFRAFGIGEQDSANMSQSLVTLAADLASFNNVPIDDALLALRSGLSGETEPLKRFGIAINEARLKEQALADGLIKTTKGTLPQAIKTQAAYSLIMKDSALAQGDVARTAGGLANQLKFLQAGLQDAKTGFGTALLPIVLSVVNTFNDSLLPAIKNVTTAFGTQGIAGGLKTLGVEIANGTTGLTGMAKIIKDVILVLIGMKVAMIGLSVGPPIIAAMTVQMTNLRIAALYGAAGFKVFGVAVRGALASTGIGLLVVGIGLVVGKLIEMRLEAGATDKTVTFMESNGVKAFRNMGTAAYNANNAIAGNIVTLNAVQLAATRAADAAEIMNQKFYKIRSQQGKNTYNPVAVPGSNSGGDGGAAASKKAADAAKKLADAAAKAAAAMEKLVAKSSAAATKALDKMNEALTTAREKLQEARDAYNGYKNSVKEAIISQFSFTSALTAFTDTQKTAKDASKKLADAQLKYNNALKTPKDVDAITEALKELTAAQEENAIATANKKTFMQSLREQATAATNFASKIQTLLAMGLSQSGIDQVIAAGADAGTAIADELIAGGAGAINETNTLLQSVKTAAAALGTDAADAFYQAGITQGQALVNGIISAVTAAGFRISGGAVALPAALQKALNSGKLTPAQVKELNALLSGVPKLAKGGIVNKPTLAMIGEAGPEAVIPLSGRGAGMGNTINLTVNAGMGADGNAIGREIVDIIKRYERVSGPVFASA